jgi:hypothetical protein
MRLLEVKIRKSGAQQVSSELNGVTNIVESACLRPKLTYFSRVMAALYIKQDMQ